MFKSLTDRISEIDKLVELATPPDNSAPIQPIMDIGNYIVANWSYLKHNLERLK